ncbi:MAG: molybdopterin molybdotransferase MoeA [Acidobacteria bacterium]|nr:molybdopterin molybdotransferase MoeA [Acidobacteriota bacterium]
MLTYEEALQEVLTQVPEPRAIRLPLRESLGRVLAHPVVADHDLPPFKKSFVDGYAVRSQDVATAPVELEVIGTVAAGSQSQPEVKAGQAVQIMTGAAVPPGADAVQMIEKTRSMGAEKVELLEPVVKGANVAAKGNEVRQGDTVLARGRVLGAAETGVLATFGQGEVEVYAAPTVAVIPTGDEIVEVEKKPAFGQIRNSNAHSLWAQCHQLGLDATVFPVTPDDPERTQEAVSQGFQYDLLLLSGGVSMGEYDYVHQALTKEGVNIFLHKAAIKPGKPIVVGRKGDHLIFGLPGNPVSAFVTFELFVRPAVRRWMGFRTHGLQRVWGELVSQTRQKPGRKFFKQARTFWAGDKFRVEPIETKGSADLVAFSRANSFIIMEADVECLQAGQRVEVVLLDNDFHEGNEYKTDSRR